MLIDSRMDTCYFLLGCVLLVIVAGFPQNELELRWSRIRDANARKRFMREIRRGFRGGRQGRLFFHAAEETHDPRNMLVLNNPPGEPLHDLYRKGFSYLHVPDFHRRPVEPRTQGRGNQSIDDIISGIIQLLGGDVHVIRAEGPPRPVPPPPLSGPSRINNRGPGQFDPSGRPNDRGTSSSLEEIVNTEPVTEIDPTIPSSSSSRWLFPDDTEVSLILGLLNQTDKVFTKEDIPQLSNSSASTLQPSFTTSASVSATAGHSIGELTPSVEINITVPHFDKTGTIEEQSSGGIIQSSFTPTSDATVKPDTNSETVHPDFHNSELHPGHETTEETDTLYKYRPIISSAFTDFITPPIQRKTNDHLIPTGPVTEWLPIATLPTQYLYSTINRTGGKEPVIITEPTQFEVTVSQQISNGNSSQRTRVKPTQSAPEIVSDITGSISITATHQLNSQDISVAIISTQVGIIYGRPSKQPDLSLPSTGRPHVYPVDISEIRPSQRPNLYQRPPPLHRPSRPEEGYTYTNNGLRPASSAPRPGANTQRRPTLLFRPPTPAQMPEIRIDTCVVGDDSTCDVQLEEHCRTERGVSSCLCRPGFGRISERGLCSAVVSMLLTIKVAKLGDRTIDAPHLVPGTQEYQLLHYEAKHAMATVFSYSPLSDGFRGSEVNGLYFLANRMVINSTIHLAESEVRGSLRHHVEHAVADAIRRHSNQVGDSQLFVRGPLSALVEVEDLNECASKELNDCSEHATCENLFGTFQCFCKLGYTDKSQGGMRSSGRVCSACSPDYCHGRGTCVVINGFQECRCRGNYAGVRCQVDNEVVGVSVGVSVIAAIVIAITAACLYLWNKRWKQAQQKTDAAKNMGYRLQTIADHVRYRTAVNTLGSTYVPADSTLQLSPPPMTTSASQLYALPSLGNSAHQHRSHLYEDEINPYGRINRTLQKPNINQETNMLYESLSSECGSSEELGFPSVPSNSFVYHGSFPHS